MFKRIIYLRSHSAREIGHEHQYDLRIAGAADAIDLGQKRRAENQRQPLYRDAVAASRKLEGEMVDSEPKVVIASIDRLIAEQQAAA